VPLTADRAGDFARVLEEASDDSRACMCTAYYGPDREGDGRAHRAAMFERGEADGYLLHANATHEPLGWCQCAPLSSGLRLPGVPADAVGVWGLTCMVLRPAFRGRGLCREFLRRILADLPRRGCRQVIVVGHRPEAYRDSPGFMELPAAVCEGAGLLLRREHAVCPLYELSFPR